MVKTNKEEELDNYTLFTREKINEYYLQSIEFVVNILNNLIKN